MTLALEPCTGLKITAQPGPACCFLDPAQPIFCLKFSDPGPFRPAKVIARPSLAHSENEMYALSHFSRKLVLAKTSKLEITAVGISLYRMNNSLAKAKNEVTIYELGYKSWRN